MKPFRTSLSARILSGAAAFSLIGAGLVPVLGLNAAWAIPAVLLLTAGAGLIGLIAGITDHLGAVFFGALLLPLVMWPYVLAVVVVVQHYPSYGWALIAAGGVPLTLFVASLGTRPEPEPMRAARHA